MHANGSPSLDAVSLDMSSNPFPPFALRLPYLAALQAPALCSSLKVFSALVCRCWRHAFRRTGSRARMGRLAYVLPRVKRRRCGLTQLSCGFASQTKETCGAVQ